MGYACVDPVFFYYSSTQMVFSEYLKIRCGDKGNIEMKVIFLKEYAKILTA